MTATEYIKKLDEISKKEFMPAIELVRALDITHNTLMRLRSNNDKSSMKTMQKVKKFVDAWEAKNLSATD